MLTDLNHVKKDIDNGLRIISKNSKFRFEIYDNEFIRFLLKNAVLFKIFSLNKFKPNNSPIVSDEFLLLTKYFSLGDYNSFVITERTAVECLMKLNLNDQLEDTTTNLINSCSFDFDEKSIITEFYKINSKIVHRSKVNDTSINTYILNMYNADNNFSPNGRKKIIKRFKKIIEIVLDKIIRNYNQQIKASFVRDKYTLRYLLGTKI